MEKNKKEELQEVSTSLLGVSPELFGDLHEVTITVIGCGGTGSLLLARLARVHYALLKIGRKGLQVNVLDDDIVEEHNVGRQMFTAHDIGRNKAVCTVSKINMAFNVCWEAVPVKYTGQDIKSNFIFTCTDNVESRKKVSNCFRSKTINSRHVNDCMFYWIDCGNGKDFGQVALFDKNDKLQWFEQLFPNIDNDANDITEQGVGCSYEDKPQEQDLFINDEIAVIASDMLWKMLYKRQLDHNVVFTNKNTMERKKGFFLA